MTLAQLRYLVEIDKTRSITWAADNLYMSQPNLSRSIKELEEKLGFDIFRRSSQGMMPTREGGEIIARAKKILAQVDAIEEIGDRKRQRRQDFGVSVSRLSYAVIAFRRLMLEIDMERPVHIDYCETGVRRAIRNVSDQRHNLAVISYDLEYEPDVMAILEAEGMAFEELCKSSARVLISRRNPLAANEAVYADDLRGLIQIQCDEEFSFQDKELHHELTSGERKSATVYCRSSLFDLVAGESRAYSLSPPLPGEALERYDLVQRSCHDIKKEYKDVAIWRGTYRLSSLDRLFVDEMHRLIESFIYGFV